MSSSRTKNEHEQRQGHPCLICFIVFFGEISLFFLCLPSYPFREVFFFPHVARSSEVEREKTKKWIEVAVVKAPSLDGCSVHTPGESLVIGSRFFLEVVIHE